MGENASCGVRTAIKLFLYLIYYFCLQCFFSSNTRSKFHDSDKSQTDNGRESAMVLLFPFKLSWTAVVCFRDTGHNNFLAQDLLMNSDLSRIGSERFLRFAPVRVQLHDGGNHFGSGSGGEKQAVQFRLRFSSSSGSTPSMLLRRPTPTCVSRARGNLSYQRLSLR